MSNTANRLPLRTKLSYGAGDLFGGGATTLISMYYLFFLTEVVQISPALAGTAFLISKIWDAVTDPFMGIITDNTRTRFGRRRPYFLAGIVLIFLAVVLMWAPVPIQREGLKFLYVLMAYLFFSTVYTLVWVPYNALPAELTGDYDERTRLSTYRMIFSNVGGILAGTLAKDVFVDMLYPDAPATGYFVMAIAYGLFFALPYIATFLYCREDPANMNAPRKEIGNVGAFLRQNLVKPFELRPFRYVVLMFLFGFIAFDSVMAMAVYFITYYLGISSMMTLLIPIYACVILAIPLTEFVSVRIGKRKTFMISCGVWVLSFAIVPFITQESASTLIYAFGALFGVATAGIQVMVFAMFPDVPDADELFSGARREGLYSGIFAFLRKGGSAVAIFLIANGIQWAGYQPPIDGVEQVQSPQFLTALILMFILIPVVFVGIALIACIRYPLTKSCHGRLKALLEVRRADANLVPEMLAEEIELKAILGDSKA